MSAYHVIFEGQLTGEKPIANVKAQLAAMFKMNATQVEALFTGKPVAIKRNIDAETAKKYTAAFKKAGAVCRIIDASDSGNISQEQEKPAAKTPAASPTQTQSVSSASSDRMTGKDIVDIKIGNVPDFGLGEAGEALPMLKPDEMADIPDISDLSFSTDEQFLVKPKDVPEPKVDIGGLSIKKD